MMFHPAPRRIRSLALAALVATAGSGCTSVLSTATMRDLLVGVDDHAAEAAIPSGPRDDASGDTIEDDSADAERRAAAIEEAISRLSKVGELDDAATATLVATLQRTDQEDWPVVVEAFAESLASSPATHTVAKADLDTASLPSSDDASPSEPDETPEPATPLESAAAPEPAPLEPEPVPPTDVARAPSPDAVTVSMPVASPTEPAEAVETAPPAPAPEVLSEPPPDEAGPELALRNACFATRVQAWGVVDRFAANRFRPGQEVIVYFELDGLSAGESAAGHTTCIDSRLRLVTKEDTTLHEWTFEPIAETCRARRRDYFARYMIRIPAGASPGRHRIELAVTDTLSGQQAVEGIDLEILPSPHTDD